MNLQSLFRIALVLTWFFATNHCLFEMCVGPDAALAHAATSEPCSGHEHEEQNSHPCGTPCDLESDASVLSSSPKQFTIPVLEFVAAFVASNSPVTSLSTRSDAVGIDIASASARPRHMRLLLDSPNAPPLI